jgi:general secretion pathway protein M
MPAVPERWRVLGGALVALLLIYLLLVHWWFTAPMLDMGEKIESLREQELTLRMEASQRPTLKKKLEQVRRFEAENPGFLPETNRELASAGLVQRLEQVVGKASQNQNACQITARTPADMPTKEPFERVVVQVRLRCAMAELGAVLHALESDSPQLFIDNLQLSSRRSPFPSGSGPGPATGRPAGTQEVSFDLYGYLKVAAGSDHG